MAHPLKKSESKREEPKLGEPRLVQSDGAAEIPIAQELAGERVADTLIRARQQLGQDLRSIADVLCIRYSYLDAIERGQYENLPGPTYAVGFMRSYADYLGLDGDQIVERFKAEADGLDSKTKLHFPTPAPEGKMPGGAVFLVAALLFAGAYGVWFYLSNQGESLGDLVAPVPAELQEMVGDTPSPAVPQVERPVAQPPAEEPAPAEPASAAPPPEGAVTTRSGANGSLPAAQSGSQAATNSESAAPQAPATPGAAASPATQAPAPQTPAVEGPAAEQTGRSGAMPRQPGLQPEPAAPASGQQAAAPDSPAPEASPESSPESSYAIPAAPESNASATAFLLNHQPTIYGEENADARIVLTASQDAWVQVRDREGNLLLTRVLRIGDSYRVPNQADLTLLTGNAGGLEITVDGSALPPLGPVGAVRRNIPLDPQALRSGAGRQP